MPEGKNVINKWWTNFEISHQTISWIFCNSIEVRFSYNNSIFLYENSISFNVADSSRFARIKEERMRLAKHNPFQRFEAPSCKLLSGELLDQAYKSTEQFAALNLAISTISKLWVQQCLRMDGTTLSVDKFVIVVSQSLSNWPSLNTRPWSNNLCTHCRKLRLGRDKVRVRPEAQRGEALGPAQWLSQRLSAPQPTLLATNLVVLGGICSWRGSSGTKHSALRWWPPSPTPWRLGACAPARAIAPWCIWAHVRCILPVRGRAHTSMSCGAPVQHSAPLHHQASPPMPRLWSIQIFPLIW